VKRILLRARYVLWRTMHLAVAPASPGVSRSTRSETIQRVTAAVLVHLRVDGRRLRAYARGLNTRWNRDRMMEVHRDQYDDHHGGNLENDQGEAAPDQRIS
jgi:hypothetical protein